MPANNELFPDVRPGDPILADQWNQITRQINALSNTGDAQNVVSTGAGIFRRKHRKVIKGTFDAITTSAMTAASDAMTGSTAFDFTFLVSDPDNAGDLKEGNAGEGTNRSLDLAAPSGTYIIVTKIGKEWRPIWVDC